MDDAGYRTQSFWHETVPGSLAPRPSLEGSGVVDVAIVGGGYTGLWTAYYLATLEPGLRIAVLEAEVAGFGASGRNGGWCLGNLAGLEALFEDPAQVEGAVATLHALFETVDEVERICEREAIDCDFQKGGTISVATVPAHRELLLEEIEHLHALGLGDEHYRWLEPEECERVIRTETNLGGLYSPHCAALHPARLARGLAEAVERCGVTIYEHSPVVALDGGVVTTARGALSARTVVRATEAYTRDLRGHSRDLATLHSLMVATEPLPEPVWKEIGLNERETFADPRRMVIYGQRTADDRLAFGARGAYFFGSEVRHRFPDRAFAPVEEILRELLPPLRDCRITHRWGGALAIPRNWQPTVHYDPTRGFATAGGYVGEGVCASALAGRTLAELMLGRESERVVLPLVGPQPPRWEPEPLRWLGVMGVKTLGGMLDRAELAGRRKPRLRGALFDAFVKK